MENIKTSYSTRIGNTTFVVCLKQSETAKKSLDTVFRGLCIREVSGGLFTHAKLDLEKIQK